VLAQLGRSFSVMTEARRLVTSGSIASCATRSTSLEIAVIGVVMQSLSSWMALLFAVQIGFQLRRMFNEVAVLLRSFPDYSAYMQRTARLIPGVW